MKMVVILDVMIDTQWCLRTDTIAYIRQSLSNKDCDSRLDFARWMMDLINETPDVLNLIWFSDESHFHLNGHVNSHWLVLTWKHRCIYQNICRIFVAVSLIVIGYGCKLQEKSVVSMNNCVSRFLGSYIVVYPMYAWWRGGHMWLYIAFMHPMWGGTQLHPCHSQSWGRFPVYEWLRTLTFRQDISP